MVSRMALVALLFISLSPSQIVIEPESAWGVADPDFLRWRSFVLKVDRFNHRLGGCPEDAPAHETERCVPSAGYWDAKLWLEMGRDAKKIWKIGK